jgi:FtsH-binding integral membrane protein
MTDQPRDWDKELSDIDRVISKQPAPTGPGTTPTGQRRFVALTWFWTGIALLLAVALMLWPFDRNCGIRLIFFIGAGGLALLAGVVGALNSWSSRSGLAHLLSLLVLVWAGTMVLREVLPRAGYAKESRDWTCPQTQPARSPAPSTQPSGQPGT